ncbi:uncharacterized protein LOC116298352 [Actinia tenebrosa]|uniref:Uncharacterized protein LOC116298352 n=1 Tax=Actinia tenebrosa TaxID=6105 RepID=A0A6P8ICD9_ACTTE|nr:uncharacterized protein LOC116298352 [Actinia tenebrosa]
MKVICAGVSKTGTKSMAKALRILGYKTYDFVEQLQFFPDEFDDYFTYGKRPDFQAMFQDVDAVTDTPASILFEELFEIFPDAKVILTVRDNEQVWAKSYSEHLKLFTCWTWIYGYMFLGRKRFRVITSLDNALLGSRNPSSSLIHIKRYQLHNQRVQQIIPKDKLLVFNVKQGWKPLCEFLGRKVPDEQFPRANVGGQHAKSFLRHSFQKVLMIMAFLVLGVAIIVFLIIKKI